MMAAFIIAVRGTIAQAILLGLAAAFSHSLIIWALAAAALRYGSAWSAETTEPYFQIASGVMIAGLALWMFWRLRRDARLEAEHRAAHEREGPHGGQLIDTGHGRIELAVFEDGVPPRFRVHFLTSSGQSRPPSANEIVAIETKRDDGSTQRFACERRTLADGSVAFESVDEIPEPHEFTAMLELRHGDHGHSFEIVFREDDHAHAHGHSHGHGHAHDHEHEHDHGHMHEQGQAHAGLGDLTGGDYADAHERAHAEDIARRFTNRQVTTPQIVWFGITGGLMPCPAAFTILLVCLQLKRFTLGFTLVGCFSLGLAITMVASGVLAAWGLRHAEKRIKNFGRFARKAPYFSVGLLTVLACFFVVEGWRHLPH
jgi:nickel/cobalt exporter